MENLSNINNTTILKNATSYIISDINTDLGDLNEEQIKILEGAENKDDFTYRAQLSIEELLALETLPDTYTLSDKESAHYNIDMNSAIIIAGALNASDYFYTILDSVENVIVQINMLPNADRITLTDESIKASDLETIASNNIVISVEFVTSITGSVSEITSLYNTYETLHTIIGLDANIIVVLEENEELSKEDLASLLSINTQNNIIINTDSSNIVYIELGWEQSSTTIIDGISYDVYTNQNKSFMVASTFENIVLRGSFEEILENLETLPEKYILSDIASTNNSIDFAALSIDEVKILLGAQNGSDYSYSVSDYEIALISELDNNTDLITNAKEVILKLSTTTDFTDNILDSRIDGIDLNGFNAVLTVPQAWLTILDSTGSETSFATAVLDNEHKNFYQAEAFGDKVTTLDYNGLSNIILSLDASQLTLIDSLNVNSKATVKYDHNEDKSTLSGLVFDYDMIDTLDLYYYSNVEISIEQYENLNIIDSYLGRNFDRYPITDNITILDTFSNLNASLIDLSLIEDIYALIDGSGMNTTTSTMSDGNEYTYIDMSNININPKITELYLNGYYVNLTAEQVFNTHFYIYGENDYSNNFEVEEGSASNGGKLLINLTQDLDIGAGDKAEINSYGSIFLNGYSAIIDAKSALQIKDINITSYELNPGQTITIKDSIEDLANYLFNKDYIALLMENTIYITNEYYNGEVISSENPYDDLEYLLDSIENSEFSLKVEAQEGILYIKDDSEFISYYKSLIIDNSQRFSLNGNKIGYIMSDDHVTIEEISNFEDSLLNEDDFIFAGFDGDIKDTAANLVADTLNRNYISKLKDNQIMITSVDTLEQLITIQQHYKGDSLTFIDDAQTKAFEGTYENLMAAFEYNNYGYWGALSVSDSISVLQLNDINNLTKGAITASFSLSDINTYLDDAQSDNSLLDNSSIILSLSDTTITVGEINTLDTRLSESTILLTSTITLSETLSEITTLLSSVDNGGVIIDGANFIITDAISLEDLAILDAAITGTITPTTIFDTAENLIADNIYIKDNVNITITDAISLSALTTIDTKTTGIVTPTAIIDTATNLLADNTYIQGSINVTITDGISLSGLGIIEANTTGTVTYSIIADTLANINADTTIITTSYTKNLEITDTNFNISQINTLHSSLPNATISITDTTTTISGSGTDFDTFVNFLEEENSTLSCDTTSTSFNISGDNNLTIIDANTLLFLKDYGVVTVQTDNATVIGSIESLVTLNEHNIFFDNGSNVNVSTTNAEMLSLTDINTLINTFSNGDIDISSSNGITMDTISLDFDLSNYSNLSNLNGKKINFQNSDDNTITLTASDLFNASDVAGDLSLTLEIDNTDTLNLIGGWIENTPTQYIITGNFDGIDGDETYTINTVVI